MEITWENNTYWKMDVMIHSGIKKSITPMRFEIPLKRLKEFKLMKVSVLENMIKKHTGVDKVKILSLTEFKLPEPWEGLPKPWKGGFSAYT